LLGRTRKELLATTTRGELLELMAYDKHFGLPDSPERIPKPPEFPRERLSGPEQYAMFKAAFQK
jgi:hypothetical protein